METLPWIMLGMVIGAVIAVAAIILLEVRDSDRQIQQDRLND